MASIGQSSSAWSLSREGLRVASVELIVLSPLLAYALWPALAWCRSIAARTRRRG
jgi:hypothetical protein